MSAGRTPPDGCFPLPAGKNAFSSAGIHAQEVCRAHDVRVYVAGDRDGRFFRMKVCDEGIDAASTEC
jgi:hypothetical protein